MAFLWVCWLSWGGTIGSGFTCVLQTDSDYLTCLAQASLAFWPSLCNTGVQPCLLCWQQTTVTSRLSLFCWTASTVITQIEAFIYLAQSFTHSPLNVRPSNALSLRLVP